MCRPQALWAVMNLATWEKQSSRLWNVLLVYWLFKKGKLCILGKLRLGKVSIESLLWQPWDFPSAPRLGIFKRKQRTRKLFYVGVKPERSKHSKTILQQMANVSTGSL